MTQAQDHIMTDITTVSAVGLPEVTSEDAEVISRISLSFTATINERDRDDERLLRKLSETDSLVQARILASSWTLVLLRELGLQIEEAQLPAIANAMRVWARIISSKKDREGILHSKWWREYLESVGLWGERRTAPHLKVQYAAAMMILTYIVRLMSVKEESAVESLINSIDDIDFNF